MGEKRIFFIEWMCNCHINIDTWKCLDVEVLSKVCNACKRQEKKPDTEEKKLWKEDHKSHCNANYKGSASAMEVKGVKKIFERSKDKNSLRYSEYYGDGDGKGFDEVANVYVCIGHVQKRVGTALWKKKKEKKVLWGKAELTDALIQNYDGIAIRSNTGSVAEMKKTIYFCLFLPLHFI